MKKERILTISAPLYILEGIYFIIAHRRAEIEATYDPEDLENRLGMQMEFALCTEFQKIYKEAMYDLKKQEEV